MFLFQLARSFILYTIQMIIKGFVRLIEIPGSRMPLLPNHCSINGYGYEATLTVQRYGRLWEIELEAAEFSPGHLLIYPIVLRIRCDISRG